MTSPLVFDTGPLRHFAQAGWLGVLKFLTHERGLVVPESVARELRVQSDADPTLRLVLDATWITFDRSDDPQHHVAFARFEQLLVPAGSTSNLGEVGVLALGKVRGWEVVIDDRTARDIAQAETLAVTATLPLLCQAIRAEQLTVSMVEHLADDLIAGTYFLPFPRGEFRRWASEQGLI